MKPSYEELEKRLEEANLLINAIRNGEIDTILGSNPNVGMMRIEDVKLVEERDILLKELQDALANVKILRGLLPICAFCKKIRDDNGYWNKVETYIEQRTEAEFTHGFCPECVKKHYPDVPDETSSKL